MNDGGLIYIHIKEIRVRITKANSRRIKRKDINEGHQYLKFNILWGQELWSLNTQNI